LFVNVMIVLVPISDFLITNLFVVMFDIVFIYLVCGFIAYIYIIQIRA